MADHLVQFCLAQKNRDASASRIDTVVPIRRTILEQELRPTAFCPDHDGEILELDWNGKVYRIEPAAVASAR